MMEGSLANSGQGAPNLMQFARLCPIGNVVSTPRELGTIVLERPASGPKRVLAQHPDDFIDPGSVAAHAAADRQWVHISAVRDQMSSDLTKMVGIEAGAEITIGPFNHPDNALKLR